MVERWFAQTRERRDFFEELELAFLVEPEERILSQ
jgi:hypothetical protein